MLNLFQHLAGKAREWCEIAGQARNDEFVIIYFQIKN